MESGEFLSLPLRPIAQSATNISLPVVSPVARIIALLLAMFTWAVTASMTIWIVQSLRQESIRLPTLTGATDKLLYPMQNRDCDGQSKGPRMNAAMKVS